MTPLADGAASPVLHPLPMKSPFYRPCWVEIDRGALRANWRRLRSRLSPGVQMLAVVKANAYGHGLSAVSQVAVEEGASVLGVSSLEEGLSLREAGFALPVLILGSLYPFDNFPLLFEKRLTPTVASLEAAAALDALARLRGERLPIHLKIDSGFGRIGVSATSAAGFIQDVAEKSGLLIEGLYTHLASSDIDPEYTRAQAKAFFSVARAAAEDGVRPRWIHLANSSALLKDPETHGTLVRPGLAFYGVPPYPGAEKEVPLAPAFTWKSRIIYLKTVAEGAPVGYARTWTARRPTRIATLAVGYADGLPRLLSNRGSVLLRGRRVPIIGRVTMDMTMVDVTDLPAGQAGLPECHVGDEVVLMGKQGDEHVTVREIADIAQTNAYEILCRIADRVPRIYP